MKFTKIQEIETKYNVAIRKECLYLENYILDLFNNDTNILTETSDSNIYYVNGFYYQNVEKNYDEMKKYYGMAIEHNNSTAMNNLGFYYQNVEKNYDEMKKYYLMAIELNDLNAMYNLGVYYKNIEKNDDEMKKYYLMAIELGNSSAMNNFGVYYKNVEKNYDEMKKYYLMAIELGVSCAMYNLGFYYENVERNDDEMKKYYLMAIELNDLDAMYRLEMNVSKVGLYRLLINIENRNEVIQNKISELEEDNKIIIKYKKIIECNDNNVKECIVCYSVEKHVKFDCKHEICINCYMKIDSCYYRCPQFV